MRFLFLLNSLLQCNINCFFFSVHIDKQRKKQNKKPLKKTVSSSYQKCRINAVTVVGMLTTITLHTPMPMEVKPMPKTIQQVQKYRIPYRQHHPRRIRLSHHL